MSRVSGLAELIRIQILQGEFAPGERLIEVTLAESLRTSRSMLREALRLLEAGALARRHALDVSVLPAA